MVSTIALKSPLIHLEVSNGHNTPINILTKMDPFSHKQILVGLCRQFGHVTTLLRYLMAQFVTTMIQVGLQKEITFVVYVNMLIIKAM
mgnify:FL=1